MGRRPPIMLIIGAMVLLISSTAHCGVQAKGQAVPQLQPASAPGAVYVADFEIDSGNIQENSGPLKGGILKRQGPLRSRDNPEEKARNLVSLLSESLTRELSDRSIRAIQLSPGQSYPRAGWLIRGEFTEVDEGNRVRRAVIGFGSGATSMQVQVNVSDLGTHPDTPFLFLGTSAESGKKPGAVVTMNPYVAAASFVMSKNASEKDVRHTAREIAEEVVKYMKEHGLMPPN